MKVNYGTNNSIAWKDLCAITGKPHDFNLVKRNRCYCEYECKHCGSTTSVDSSD